MSRPKSISSLEAFDLLKTVRSLAASEMTALMRGIMREELTDGQITDVLSKLRDRGTTAEELAAAAKVMREESLKLPQVFPDLVDTCGTGGDGQRTLNVSTLSAIVACAAGACVAKHGNRSVSSVCGSADLLEKLGVKIDLSPESLATCLTKTGFAFFFAPRYHPAVKAAMPARKRLGGKTLFNILGPLSNPAGADHQVIGVYEPKLVNLVADALVRLGVRHAMVVHGRDGMDEISLSAETLVAEVRDGKVLDYTIMPEDFGLKQEPLSNIQCPTPEAALEAAQRVLRGDAGAGTKIVCLNAAAALYVAGLAKTMKEGLLMAMNAVEAQKAEKKIRVIAQLTQGLS